MSSCRKRCKNDARLSFHTSHVHTKYTSYLHTRWAWSLFNIHSRSQRLHMYM